MRHTIDTLAQELRPTVQPHELSALTDVPQGVELDPQVEAFVRDVHKHTGPDGVYRWYRYND